MKSEDVEYFNLPVVKDNANSMLGEIYCHVWSSKSPVYVLPSVLVNFVECLRKLSFFLVCVAAEKGKTFRGFANQLVSN